MSHRILAVGLTVLLAALLIASMLFVLAPGPTKGVARAETVTGAKGAAEPAAAITARIANGFEVLTDRFYLGAVGYGSLYFLVFDPLDRAVNVTITDPNAARDKVGVPAYSYEATLNATTHMFNSYAAGVSYTFPTGILYGGQWTVNFSAPAGGTVLENVTLDVYYTSLTTTAGSSATLPGQAIGVFWALNLYSNSASPYTKATSVTIYGSYTANGTLANLFPPGGLALSPVNTGRGEWTGAVPANAGPGTELHIEVSAVTNVSGQVTENESANITINVGTLVIEGVGLTTAPPNCELFDAGFFTAGTVLAGCVEVGATYGGAFTAISGLPITVGYWNGTAHVTPTGAPTQLTSNATGEAAFTFLGTSPPFTLFSNLFVYNAVNFTATVPRASPFYHWTVYSNTTDFTLVKATASGVVQLTLDHTTYYSGATATASWSVSSTNLTKTGPLTAVGWTVTGPTAITYEEGALNVTGASGTFSGTFTFPILAAMAAHTIDATLYVVNATETFSATATAAVLNPSLLLTPAEYYYSAGTSTSVSVILNGGGTGATIQYQAWEYWASTDALLSNGTVANGSSIPITIPATVPPLSVVVSVWASIGGQVIASSSTAILLAQGYSIEFGVSTVSSYSDGSFQPGQTVTLNYKVVSVGGAALPQVLSFELFAIGYPYIQTLQNVGPSGSVPFTIPSSAPQGTIVIELLARGALTTGTCFPAGTCDGIAALYVNPSPSVLNLELGAGSGITVGWLILFVLVALVAIALFLLFRRRGGRAKPAPATPSSSASPPQEWKAPSPAPPAPEAPASEPTSSDTPPPLPPPSQPPAGAT
jgi:hypothetical protein